MLESSAVVTGWEIRLNIGAVVVSFYGMTVLRVTKVKSLRGAANQRTGWCAIGTGLAVKVFWHQHD